MATRLTSALCADDATRPVGYQSWRDLLFVHWRLAAADCQALLPAGLTVDTWQGEAWIGLVAFRMQGIRPRWAPALPYLSAFPETNVRTYVRCAGGEPGVYFFSLDAPRLAAVLVARWKWALAYHWARMQVERAGETVRYHSHRIGRSLGAVQLTAEIAPPLAPATAGTLEEFLVERYVFYNRDARGRWRQGRVRHRPYPLQPARLLECKETLLPAGGIDRTGPPDHVLFSPGVDVDIVGLRPVEVR